jgi:hypothetical protein
MLKIGFAILTIATVTIQPATQPDNCAPRERRVNAIRHARIINTAEAMAFSKDRRYAPLASLQIAGLPDDYRVQFTTDNASYAFSIKDQTDSCHGVVFSDQDGLIYTGGPLQ